ncbi:methyl-accepting chemotaxis protein [Bacillus salitolerans]|uniref:Methyl-accepting chemotaxis protein n=1 Tax=Bacillus salitolerans TaxID=1437434 RepID=A0ABW4LPV7_9BACI
MKSIRLKILLSFLIVIGLSVIMAVYNYFSITLVNNETNAIIKEDLPLLIADETLSFNIAQRIALARGYILYGDKEFKEDFMEYTEKSKSLQEEVMQMSDSEEVKALIESSKEWRTLITDKVFPAYDSGQIETAKLIMNVEAQPLARELISEFEALSKNREQKITHNGEIVLKHGESIKWIGLVVSILIVILGLVVATFISNSLTKPIHVVMNRMKEIAQGDLSQDHLKSKSKDEVGQLIKATNQMSDHLKVLLAEINSVSETVTGQSEELTQSASEIKEGSQQVASTMQELAAGAEHQASSSSDLAQMMDQLSEQIAVAHEESNRINVSSKTVLQDTQKGNDLMNRSEEQMLTIDQIVRNAVERVKGLDQQSQKISKLVDVIQEISAQTNLLALNAAIEAARAGEQGRGFAVVADEVRKLAEQVSASIEDITEIVKNVQEESNEVVNSLQDGYSQVVEGTEQIKVTSETFKNIQRLVTGMGTSIEGVARSLSEIADNGKEMNGSISNIASVSEEAAAGIEQTSASAQQTVSSMEEVSSSADSLAQLAENLNSLVRKFKI